jgi:hypothetical protein
MFEFWFKKNSNNDALRDIMKIENVATLEVMNELE